MSHKHVIENAFVNYYTIIFGPVNWSDWNRRTRGDNARHPPSETAFLEEEITLEEVKIAVSSFPVQKSLGPDGISAEFHKRYSSTVRPILYSYTKPFDYAHYLPFYCMLKVLISKSNSADKLRLVTVYRPISLCIVDYKTYAQVVTNLLQTVICGGVGVKN